jgi:hypothetical protein
MKPLFYSDYHGHIAVMPLPVRDGSRGGLRGGFTQ